MGRRPSQAVVALASATALLAGCGAATNAQTVSPMSGTNNSSQQPAAELRHAVSALGNASTLTTTVKLGTTAKILGPILTSLGADLTPTQVAALAGAQISLEVAAPDGETINDLAKKPASAAVDFTVSSNGTTYVELRHVNKTIYLQVDVKDLLTLVGDPGEYATLQAKAANLPAFVQALLNDKWISLPDATLSLLKSLGGGGLGSATTATPNLARSLNLIAALRTLLTHDVQVTRLSAGTTDRLQLTAHSRVLARELVLDLHAVFPRIGHRLHGGRLGRIPNVKVRLRANVVHGALSKLSINIGQYSKSHKIHVPLEVLFARSGPEISAPSGAVPVDLSGLLGLASLAGGQGNGLASLSGV
jgi:hypothetical protein